MNANDFTERVRRALLLSTVITDHVKLKKRGREFLGLCPFHSEKTPSFTVNDQKGLYYCFGCGAKGDHFDFVMSQKGLTFPEAMELLSEKSGVPLPPKNQDTKRNALGQSYRQGVDLLTQIAQWYQSQLSLPKNSAILEYCVARGLEKTTMERFMLGYAPDSLGTYLQQLTADKVTQDQLVAVGILGKDEESGRYFERFRNRVMVPITTPQGKIVAFGGRALSQDAGAKYINSAETDWFKKGELLYGWPQAQAMARKDNLLLIVEGYFDVMMLHQHGLPCAVAPLGTALTAAQLELAWQAVATPVICFDGDAAGLRAAARALEVALPHLKPGKSIDFLFLPSGDDPDSFVRRAGGEAFKSLLTQKVQLVDFLWQTENAKSPISSPEQKADLRARLRQAIRVIQHPEIRSLYGEELKNRLIAVERSATSAAYSRKQTKGGSYANKDSGALLVRPRKQLAAAVPTLQQKILLAIALNYPQVVAGDIERLMWLAFSPGPLEELKKDIIQYIVAGEPLEKEAIISYLNKGHGETIDLIQRTITNVHVRFAAKDAPLEIVMKGWQEVVSSLTKQESLQKDVDAMKGQLKEQMTGEHWQRLKAMLSVQTQDPE